MPLWVNYRYVEAFDRCYLQKSFNVMFWWIDPNNLIIVLLGFSIVLNQYILFFELHSIPLDFFACTTCAQVLHGSFPFSCRLRFNFECFLGATDCPDLTHLYSGITILAMLLTRLFVVLFLHFLEGANYLIIIMVNSKDIPGNMYFTDICMSSSEIWQLIDTTVQHVNIKMTLIAMDFQLIIS